MSDFGATYDEMETTASNLDTGKTDIDDLLTKLQGYVDELVEDGFKTEKASGKYRDGYQDLTDGLKEAAQGVEDMAQALRDMSQAIKDTDTALAGG
ncbi:MAG: WXG100 family type VII secretion target [Actinomycetota bacterium]